MAEVHGTRQGTKICPPCWLYEAILDEEVLESLSRHKQRSGSLSADLKRVVQQSCWIAAAFVCMGISLSRARKSRGDEAMQCVQSESKSAQEQCQGLRYALLKYPLHPRANQSK